MRSFVRTTPPAGPLLANVPPSEQKNWDSERVAKVDFAAGISSNRGNSPRKAVRGEASVARHRDSSAFAAKGFGGVRLHSGTGAGWALGPLIGWVDTAAALFFWDDDDFPACVGPECPLPTHPPCRPLAGGSPPFERAFRAAEAILHLLDDRMFAADFIFSIRMVAKWEQAWALGVVFYCRLGPGGRSRTVLTACCLARYTTTAQGPPPGCCSGGAAGRGCKQSPVAPVSAAGAAAYTSSTKGAARGSAQEAAAWT